MTSIVVCGSLNADYIIDVARLPDSGETVIGGNLRRLAGGKGGNQAHAAARVAADDTTVRMVGRVGRDEIGDGMRRELANGGADVTGVIACDLPSGIALITVAEDGSNTIVVAPGANADWSQPTLGLEALEAGDVVLLQLEIPVDAARAIAAFARGRGARVILNAAPAHSAATSLLPMIDVIVVNEIEAEQVFGVAQLDTRSIAAVRGRIPCDLVVTRGAHGCTVAAAPDDVRELSALDVQAVDSVGAGDAFVGALVAALAGGADLVSAARVGNAAGGLTTTVPGPRHHGLTRDAVLELAGGRA